MKEIMHTSELTVYLDMDGVIADFDKFAVEMLGQRFDTYPDSASAWKAMEPHQDVYLRLDPMPDAKELVEGVYALQKEFHFHIAVLTAIPKIGRIPEARRHKKLWLLNWFPELLNDFNIGPHAEHKQFHCRVGDVLIDDSDKNIPQWENRMGKGILHTSASKSLLELETYLIRWERDSKRVQELMDAFKV